MIAINKIPLNQVEKDNPFRKIYEKACNALRKEQESYTLKFVPALMTKKDPLEPTSKDEYPTGINFMASKRYTCEEGECEFTYYTGASQKKHGLEFTPRRLDFTKAKTYSVKNDIDLLFYMIFVSDLCQVDDRFKSLQNGRRNPNSQYYVEDPTTEAKRNLNYEKIVTKVRNLFFDEERSMSDRTVEELCAIYKIETENRPAEELRTQLAGTVMKLDKELRYIVPELEKFVQHYEEYAEKAKGPVKTADVFEVDQEIILTALQKQFIRKEETDEGKMWLFYPAEGEPSVITKIEFAKGKHDVQLMNALKENKELYQTISASVS